MNSRLPQAFLDTIVADIDNDAPRLIYADWLDEQGDSDRAEFIRVQIERVRLPSWDAAQLPLRLREQELLKRHGEKWLAEMPAIKGAKWEGFRRGIVAEVSFASFAAMRFSAHACRAVAPVESVTVPWPRRREGKIAIRPIAELRELTLISRPYAEEISRLADSPQLSTLHTLTVLGLEAQDLSRLAASPHLTGLRVLRLASNGLGTAGIRALTQAATLTALEELDLSGPGYYEAYYDDPIINVAGMELLAGWPGLARVRSLSLWGSDVRRDGLRALLRSPHARVLKDLSLRIGRLDGQALAEFRDAQPGLLLETLDLGENVLQDYGAEYIATAPCLRELKTLWLDRCELLKAGTRRFAEKASNLVDLRQLDIGYNHFGPIGLANLLERGPALLHTLILRDNDLFDEGAKLLAESPASDNLLEVDLSQNNLGPAAAKALSESKHLRNLLILRLADNPIGESAAVTLAASPLGQRLAVLE